MKIISLRHRYLKTIGKESANGSLDTLYELRKLCMPSFISSGNADFCYIFNADYINDSRAFTYQILKAS